MSHMKWRFLALIVSLLLIFPAFAGAEDAIPAVRVQLNAEGYDGIYDGAGHGIRLTVKDPIRGATVMYGEREDACDMAASPIYTDVGSHTVYYKATAKGYAPSTGSVTVTIRKKAVTVIADEKQKLPGNPDPELTYTAFGMYNDDRLTGSLSREPGEAKGVYAITQGTLSVGDNYKIVYSGSTLTIGNTIALTGDSDLTLMALLETSGDTALKLSWTAVEDAEGYDLGFASCQWWKEDKQVVSIEGNSTFSHTFTGLKAQCEYKARVKAWRRIDGEKVYIGNTSPSVYSITGGFTDSVSIPTEVTAKPELTIALGKSKTIKGDVSNLNPNRKVLRNARLLRFYSNDNRIASVDKYGRVKGESLGTCTICVMANNGLYTNVTVTVTDQPTRIGFRKPGYSIYRGKTLNLQKLFGMAPKGVKSKCTWESANPEIASVSSRGVVRALKKGRTTITVTTENGLTAEVRIKVK